MEKDDVLTSGVQYGDLESGVRLRMIRRSSTVAAHSHLPLSTKSLSVREFTPSEETVESCKARIGRIVSKQKKCYTEKSMECPIWLDEDFIYQLNYGPANSAVFTSCVTGVVGLLEADTERERIILLDRLVAEKLHKAMFGEYYVGTRFLTDWGNGPIWLILSDEQTITPFDYDPLVRETKLFMNCETFIATEVLDQASLRTAFCNPRPSMVPIALDIVALIKYFGSIHLPRTPFQKSKTINQILLDFLNTHELHSVDKTVAVLTPTIASQDDEGEGDKRILRYLADMLKSVTSLQDDDYWEVLGRRFPGPNLILGDPPGPPSSSLTQIFLDDFTADFICSGPFKLIETDDIRQHLRLTDDNEVQLFMNYDEFLTMYNSHSLKRHMFIDDIKEEVDLSLSLLFSRNYRSQRLASKYKYNPKEFSLHLQEFNRKYKRQPDLQDFTVFRPHLALLQQRMRDWKPRSLWELTRPGYYDRFGWYTAIFGVIFGVLGALSLIVSAVQLALAVVALQLAQQSINLQLQQMSSSTPTTTGA